jgi:hypothetical protein
MALVATIGGTASNSYVTLAEADAYFEDRLYTTEWDAATPTDKEKALVTATRRIDEELFTGEKTTLAQALKWPRIFANDEGGDEFAADIIPTRLLQATCIVALELLKADFIAESYLNNYSFLSTGTMQFKQFTQQSAGRLPSEAVRLLRILITSAGGGRLVRA